MGTKSPLLPGTPPAVASRELTDIVWAARRWAERYAKKTASLWVEPESLSGMCAIASAHLHSQLTRAGFAPSLFEALREDSGEAHIFVTEGAFLLDITASQFGEADVVILPLPRTNLPWYWKASIVHSGTRQLRKRQMLDGWPSEQTVPHFIGQSSRNNSRSPAMSALVV